MENVSSGHVGSVGQYSIVTCHDMSGDAFNNKAPGCWWLSNKSYPMVETKLEYMMEGAVFINNKMGCAQKG